MPLRQVRSPFRERTFRKRGLERLSASNVFVSLPEKKAINPAYTTFSRRPGEKSVFLVMRGRTGLAG